MNFTEILKDCEDTWHKQKSLEEQIEKYFEEKIPQSRGKFLSCDVNKTFLRVKLIIHKGYDKKFLQTLTDIEGNFSVVFDRDILVLDFLY